MTKSGKARKYELECGHEVWWETAPHIGDLVTCVKCNRETQVGPVGAKSFYWTYQEFWRSRRERMGGRTYEFVGECMDPPGRGWNRPEIGKVGTCSHTEHDKDWFKLRSKMDRHFLQDHAMPERPAYVFRDTVSPTKTLPRNSPPPF